LHCLILSIHFPQFRNRATRCEAMRLQRRAVLPSCAGSMHRWVNGLYGWRQRLPPLPPQGRNFRQPRRVWNGSSQNQQQVTHPHANSLRLHRRGLQFLSRSSRRPEKGLRRSGRRFSKLSPFLQNARSGWRGQNHVFCFLKSALSVTTGNCSSSIYVFQR